MGDNQPASVNAQGQTQPIGQMTFEDMINMIKVDFIMSGFDGTPANRLNGFWVETNKELRKVILPSGTGRDTKIDLNAIMKYLLSIQKASSDALQAWRSRAKDWDGKLPRKAELVVMRYIVFLVPSAATHYRNTARYLAICKSSHLFDIPDERPAEPLDQSLAITQTTTSEMDNLAQIDSTAQIDMEKHEHAKNPLDAFRETNDKPMEEVEKAQWAETSIGESLGSTTQHIEKLVETRIEDFQGSFMQRIEELVETRIEDSLGSFRQYINDRLEGACKRQCSESLEADPSEDGPQQKVRRTDGGEGRGKRRGKTRS